MPEMNSSEAYQPRFLYRLVDYASPGEWSGPFRGGRILESGCDKADRLYSGRRRLYVSF